MIKLNFLFYFLCCPIMLMATYRVNLSSAWYPAKGSNILSSIEQHEKYASLHYDANLDKSKIRAIIVPHAGWKYSGNVAVAAYRLLPLNFFKRIIVLAPSHHDFFDGVVLPSKEYEVYKNQFGSIDLDIKVLKELSLEKKLFFYKDNVHELEHSINIQIPFIQNYCGKECKLVPLLVGELTVEKAELIAKSLTKFIDKNTLVVVSSDFVHYGPRFSYEPFKDKDNISGYIAQLDSLIVSKIQEQSLDGFDKVLKDTDATVCGKNPIKILLAMIKQKIFNDIDAYVVGYDTSDSSVKNPEHSVSYVSCIISNELKNNDKSGQIFLTKYEQEMLLKVARDHLQNVIGKGIVSDKLPMFPGLLTKSLKNENGVFVTLYKFDKKGNKELRGCIGNIISTKSLYEAVYDLVITSALQDSRFEPVSKEELSNIEISISVLSKPKNISSYQDIVINKDGVILKNKDKSAVYLPKVASEQGWNLQQMLESLSKKAGLQSTDWKDKNSKYQTFTSVDFAEDKDPLEFMYEGYKK